MKGNIPMNTWTINGGAVVVTVDKDAGVLYVYSPFYTDPSGAPYVTSFGYGPFLTDPKGQIDKVLAFLGFKPLPA